ncbi:MAG TPA: hypothetical protein ENK57_15560 [Polyangiaceae bacterium]|nr:hypothetical protein [Polyangiaceae bacterium]
MSKKTLEENDIDTQPVIGRRSSIRAVGAAVLGAAALAAGAAVTPQKASAQSDSDGGPNADPAGRGRTGVTDSDGGSNADRAGHGRGRRCSDADGGNYADPAGRGRHC